jgi:DNA-binding transcriptional regulator of glucitol operon
MLWFPPSAMASILPQEPAPTAHSGAAYPESVLRRYSFTLRPGWLLLHVLTLAAIITMIFLGRWQLHVSESKHFSLQNTGYTIQWWVFAGFTGFFWWRVVRDAAQRRTEHLHPAPAEPEKPLDQPVPYRHYIVPTTPEPTDDPQLRAYNDYLAQLAAKDAEEKK